MSSINIFGEERGFRKGWSGGGGGREGMVAEPVSYVDVWSCHYHFSSLTMPTKRVLHGEGSVAVSVMYFSPNVTNDIAPNENSYGPLTQARIGT